jgi:hypothetical protein
MLCHIWHKSADLSRRLNSRLRVIREARKNGDVFARTGTEIKGTVLPRLVLLALRHIFSDAPAERLRELLRLIVQIEDTSAATEVLYVLLRYYVHASGSLGERDVRALLAEIPSGETLMQTRYLGSPGQIL